MCGICGLVAESGAADPAAVARMNEALVHRGPDDGSVDAFASELKALLRLPGLSRELDPEALDAYLALQYVPGPRTALRGIEKLPPGSLLVFEDGRVRVERYWRLEPRTEALTEDEWVERV